MSFSIRPFRVEVPDAALRELHDRLDRARWPELPGGIGWSFGTDAEVMRGVCRHWRHEFDWRTHEAWLNAEESYRADVDGTGMHVVVAESAHPNAMPLVLLHGWPSTVHEFRRVVDALVDPCAHGGNEHDAFDVVLVSLPGFGFSGPTGTPDWDADRMARAIATVMAALGRPRYGVFGTDAGAYVAASLAAFDPDHVAGMHLHLGGVGLGRQARLDPSLASQPTADEQRAFEALDRYERTDSAYASLNMTKPYTLAYALGDSPIGQAAWILEKFHTWTDTAGFDPVTEPFGAVSVDDALAIVSTYWFSGTAGSAAQFYAATAAALATRGQPRVEVPTACAVFPGDIVAASRRWAERTYPNIVHWRDMPSGGHFSALEVPDLLIEDWRSFFGTVR